VHIQQIKLSLFMVRVCCYYSALASCKIGICVSVKEPLNSVALNIPMCCRFDWRV